MIQCERGLTAGTDCSAPTFHAHHRITSAGALASDEVHLILSAAWDLKSRYCVPLDDSTLARTYFGAPTSQADDIDDVVVENSTGMGEQLVLKVGADPSLDHDILTILEGKE